MGEPGNITIDPKANVWPHELATAKALAHAGYDIRFLRGCDGPRMHKADVVMNGQLWEMKSPETKNPARLVDVMSKALHQARCIIIDTSRMTKVTDERAERELRRAARIFGSLKHLIMVCKDGSVIVLK